VSLLAALVTSPFFTKTSILGFFLQVFVSDLSCIDLHRDCLILFLGQGLELLSGCSPFGLFGTEKIVCPIAHGFLDDREPLDFLSSGFFPLIDSVRPSFFIEDCMEHSLS
jgi:hypothetical protein